MKRGLWTSLLLLLAVLAGGVILTSAAAAPPQKAAQAKDTVELPPPPKSTTLAPRPKLLNRSIYAGFRYLISQQQRNGGWVAGDQFAGFGFVGGRPGRPAQMGPPTDVANTSVASLALLRAGYTPRQGT
jgi:hypothetical protein